MDLELALKQKPLFCQVATTEFNIFGWQPELGISGDVLSAGASWFASKYRVKKERRI